MPGFYTTEKVSPDPAANNEIVFTADENMVVHSVSMQLVTDANAANRRVILEADDGADIFFASIASADQAATLTWRYAAAEGAPASQFGTYAVLQLPSGGLRIPKGGRLRTVTVNRQAGDNFTAMVLNVERI